MGEVKYVVCPLCLTENTKIYTNPRFQSLRELNKQDRIAGLRKEQTILSKFGREYQGDIIQIKPQYLPIAEMTPEHPMLVGEVQHFGRTHKVKTGDILWKEAKDVQTTENRAKVYDCVLVPASFKLWHHRKLDLRPFIHCTGKTALPWWLPLTKELAEFMGWYVAEGNPIFNKALVFSLSKMETENIERIRELAKQLGYTSYIAYGKGQSIQIIVNSRVLSRVFPSWFGRGARNKQVPSFLMKESSKEIIKAFLSGYMKGDSYDRGANFSAKTVSEQLARQLQMIFLRLSLPVSYSEAFPKWSIIDGRPITGGKQFLLQGYHRTNESTRYFKKKGFYWFPIRHKEAVPFSGRVYNIETEQGIYLLPFVVHNCGMNRVLEKTGASAIARGLSITGIKGRIRFDIVDLDNATIVQIRERAEGPEKSRRLGRGGGSGFVYKEGLTLDQMKADPDYQDLIEQIKITIENIQRKLA